MSGPRWEEYSLNENVIYNFVGMKYITLLILLFSLTSCSENNNKTEGPQFDEIMNLLHERTLKQMQSIPDTVYYFKQSPIIEALIESDTTNRTRREKLKSAYKRSQEMSDSECDAILESYKKDSNDRE